jgi:hypothetical protein
MVEYKNYDEQVEILKSRGLLIANETQAKYILKVNNYYNVVNAYKDIFKELIKRINISLIYVTLQAIDSPPCNYNYDKREYTLLDFSNIYEWKSNFNNIWNIAQLNTFNIWIKRNHAYSFLKRSITYIVII